MLKMRNIACLMLCFVILVLTGCSDSYTTIATNDSYQIVTDGEDTYIRFDKKQQQELEQKVNHSQCIDWPQYNTLGDMKQAILEGDFTENVKAHLYASAKKNEKGDARICKVNQLYEPLLPDGASISFVAFDGSYWFEIVGDSLICNLYYAIDENDYNSNFEYHYSATIEENVTGTYIETYQGVPVTVYEKNSGWMYKCYDLSNEAASLTVMEMYASSKDIPFGIRFFGNTNGAFYHGLICEAGEMTIDHRPSVEWLQSFGLKPYVETEAE